MARTCLLWAGHENGSPKIFLVSCDIFWLKPELGRFKLLRRRKRTRLDTRFGIQVFLGSCHSYRYSLLILIIQSFLSNGGLHICMAYRSRQIGLLLISPRSSCIFDNPNMSFRSKMISRKRRRYDVGVYLAYVEGFSTMLRREGFDVKSA